NPFPKKIRDKETLQGYMDSDEKLSQISLKVEYYEVILSYIDSILKQLFQRNYQIKNAIDFMKFTSGLG
ncbi:MAG: recombination mediator protein UvsY, partial [Minisyncoccia bacterium]